MCPGSGYGPPSSKDGQVNESGPISADPSAPARNANTARAASDPVSGGAGAPGRGANNRLLYRFGFVALDRDAYPREAEAHATPRDLGWAARRMGSVMLWTHPEAPLRILRAGETRLVFVGDAVPETDPAAGDPFAPERLAQVVAGGDTALLDFLDIFAGRFALLVIEPGRIRVFHDPLGSRTVFYHAAGPFAVASHVDLLARCVGAPPEAALAAVIDHPDFHRRKTRSLPGDLTPAAGIYALTPNNCFDSATGETFRYWPREPNRPGSLETFHARLDQSMAALGRYVSGRYAPVIGATGGVDTRVVIAAFMNLDLPFETVTWTPKALSGREREIIGALVARTGAPHLDTRPASGGKGLREIIWTNVGRYRYGYRATFEMRAAYADRPDTVFLRGHGAEVMRGFFNLWPTRMEAATPAELARLFWAPKKDRAPPEVEEMFAEFMRRAHYDALADKGFDPNDIYYWEHRLGMWSAGYNNEFDVACRSLIAFNSRPLFEAALALPPKVRLSKRLLLAATRRLEPRLASLPLYKMVEAPEAQEASRARDLVSAIAKAARRGRRWLSRQRRRLRALAAQPGPKS